VTRVKICGIKAVEDGLAALEAGADMLGFVFYRPVSRFVEPGLVAEIVRAGRAEFEGWQAVGVFVNTPPAEVNEITSTCDLDLVQLAGEELPDYCAELNRPAIKVLRSREPWRAHGLQRAQGGYTVERFMVDSHVDGFYGGTGLEGDWDGLRGLLDGQILAGGLRPDNVALALRVTNAWGVDVSTGVERDGRKDPALVREFIAAVRAYDASCAPASVRG